MILDGTICEEKEKETNFLEFANVKPIYEVVEKMRMLHKKGDKIIISTARHMGTTKGNLGLINARVSKLTIDWLDKIELIAGILFLSMIPLHSENHNNQIMQFCKACEFLSKFI